MAELQVLRGDAIVHVRAIGATPVHIGRAPTNDLVLTDKQISSRHAVVWIEAGEYRVEDLGSRNHTFVNDKQVTGPTSARDGDVIRLGTNTLIRLHGEPASAEIRLLGSLLLEDRTAGVRYPVRSDRFRIGSAADADLRVADGPAIAGTLVFHAAGEVHLVTDDDDVALDPDAPFDVAGHTLCLREVRDAVSRTEGVEATKYAYRLRAAIDGGAGPEAVIEDGERRYRIDTENRATLLYLLARQAARDRDQGIGEADRGWCTDDDIAVGIWGRDKSKHDPNNYHVLVCRLRKELREAGFDPLFIEKRRKYIRLRLDHVTVD
jgi:pSer/pThr/pTyr-binding forkhead associated (FHA) protein